MLSPSRFFASISEARCAVGIVTTTRRNHVPDGRASCPVFRPLYPAEGAPGQVIEPHGLHLLRRDAGSGHPQCPHGRWELRAGGLSRVAERIAGSLSEPTALGPKDPPPNVYRGNRPVVHVALHLNTGPMLPPTLVWTRVQPIRECPCLLWLGARERSEGPRGLAIRTAPHLRPSQLNPADAMNAHTTRRSSARPSTSSNKRLSTLRLLVLQLIVTLLGAMLLTTGLLA